MSHTLPPRVRPVRPVLVRVREFGFGVESSSFDAHDPVEDDGQQHNHESRFDPHADLHRIECAYHRHTEAPGAHECDPYKKFFG